MTFGMGQKLLDLTLPYLTSRSQKLGLPALENNLWGMLKVIGGHLSVVKCVSTGSSDRVLSPVFNIHASSARSVSPRDTSCRCKSQIQNEKLRCAYLYGYGRLLPVGEDRLPFSPRLARLGLPCLAT